MQLKLSAKKLAFIIPAILIVLFAGALALAKTGHFEPLANFLNIKADVGVQPVPNPCDVTVVSDTSNKVDQLLTAVNAYKSPSWTSSIPGASWIWVSEKVQNPAINETHSFTKQFEWKGSTVSSAILQVASDNNYKVYINGAQVKSGENFTSYDEVSVTSQIKSGTNEIRVEVTNIGIPNSTPEGNPAGLLYKLNVTGNCAHTPVPTPSLTVRPITQTPSVTKTSTVTTTVSPNPIQTTFTVKGMVTGDGGVLEGVLVGLGTKSVSSNGNGEYSIDSIATDPIDQVITFKKDGYETYSTKIRTANKTGTYAYKVDAILKKTTPTVIEGNLTIGNKMTTNVDILEDINVTVSFKGSDKKFETSVPMTAQDQSMHYKISIPPSEFPYGNNFEISICAKLSAEIGSRGSFSEFDLMGCWSTAQNATQPTMMPIQKGQEYKNINIVVYAPGKEIKIKFVDSATGQPVDLTKESISKNEIDCIFIPSTNLSSKCDDAENLDTNDPNHSTYIYEISQLVEGGDLALFYDSQKYTLPPIFSVPYDAMELEARLVDKSSFNDTMCHRLGGVNFFTFPPELWDDLDSDAKSRLNEVGNIYFQLNLVAGLPSGEIPTVVVMDFGKFNSDDVTYYGLTWLNTLNAGCLKSKYIIGLNEDVVRTGLAPGFGDLPYVAVHEFGHNLLIPIFLPSAEKNAIGRVFKNASDRKCNENSLCFSDYSMSNANEMWAEFFAAYLTDRQSITDALNDPCNGDKNCEDCKATLSYLLAMMQKKFPNLPTFTPTFAQTSMTSSALGMVLGDTTSSGGFDRNSLVASMQKMGYTESDNPLIKASIGYSTLLALTPTQILAGKWLQEKYDTMTPIQKANFNLAVVSSQVNMWVTNNRAITYIRTQIANMTASIENWLGTLGFNFTSSKLTGTLLDQDGRPVSGFKITVGETPEKGKYDITKENGQFYIPRLPTGNQRLMINDPKNNNASYAVYDYFTKNTVGTITVAPNTNYTKYLMIRRSN